MERRIRATEVTLKLLLISSLLLLSSCVQQGGYRPTPTQSKAPPVKAAAAQTPETVSADTATRKVELKAVIADLKRGQSFGQLYGGPFCKALANLEWERGKTNFTTEKMVNVFNDTLSAYGHSVAGISKSIFQDDSSSADLLIGASIRKLDANICKPLAHIGNDEQTRGGIYIRVDWEVYSAIERRVVANFSTEGSYDSGLKNVGESQVLLENAFAAATENLLAEPSYVQLVTTSLLAEEIEFEEMGVRPVAQFRHSIQKNMQRIRSAVVTIYTPGAHGSGFFISKDGYILTNQHVVGSSDTVRVVLASGDETYGRVLRKHPMRDVALVKIDAHDLDPLPLKPSPEEVGMDVYAIGSPLDGALSSTVSKGILSAYRKTREGLMIQSDTMIHGGSSGGPLLNARGNVIGITVAGAKEYAGVNFFIPISEALNTLNIRLTNNPSILARKPAPPAKPKPRYGQLIVHTDPDNAQILLTEGRHAYVPGLQLQQGNYRIRVSMEGYETQYKNIIIREGINEYRVSLERNQIGCDACLGISGCPFVDNGDGTVLDTRTNMVWTRCPVNRPWNGQDCSEPGNTIASMANIGRHIYAGRSDWRLPSIAQWRSIIVNECASPIVYSDVFPGISGWVGSADPGVMAYWNQTLDMNSGNSEEQHWSANSASIYGVINR